MGRPRKEIPGVLTEETAEAPEQTKVETPKAEPVEKKVVFKPSFSKTREAVHHVAKLMPAVNIKNKSFKPGGYIAFPQEHSHIWHSISSHSGQRKTHAEPMLGHTHEIKFEETAEGMAIECGPAVQISNQKIAGGALGRKYVKKVLRKAVFDETGEQVEGPIVDDHVHEIQYIKSEKLEIKI